MTLKAVNGKQEPMPKVVDRRITRTEHFSVRVKLYSASGRLWAKAGLYELNKYGLFTTYNKVKSPYSVRIASKEDFDEYAASKTAELLHDAQHRDHESNVWKRIKNVLGV